MIARPPEKRPFLKSKTLAPLFLKVANDNRPPQRTFFGWVLLAAGVLLLLGAFFWLYARLVVPF